MQTPLNAVQESCLSFIDACLQTVRSPSHSLEFIQVVLPTGYSTTAFCNFLVEQYSSLGPLLYITAKNSLDHELCVNQAIGNVVIPDPAYYDKLVEQKIFYQQKDGKYTYYKIVIVNSSDGPITHTDPRFEKLAQSIFSVQTKINKDPQFIISIG